MTAWYNDNESFASAWLENLIRNGQVAFGAVERRSILELTEVPQNAIQAHFFAGIGAWSYALRIAGWPDSVPVWTGSCPCQPFSVQGKKEGTEDERHLWPAWFRLITKHRPPVIFGEQVASRLGFEWLASVRADLESAGYVVGASNLPAAGVAAPHIRQRVWFSAFRVADSDKAGCKDERAAWAHAYWPFGYEFGGRRASLYWSDSRDLWCSDGVWRPSEPGAFPLAHGAPQHVGQLRSYGNSIVAPLAAEFIRCSMMAAREVGYVL